ncbi:MAG: phospholipid carrier-dependent glycosyltransferase, partial [Lysobacterales bacterium]
MPEKASNSEPPNRQAARIRGSEAVFLRSAEILKPLLIAAVFVALLYPYYSDYISFHPDERHYTNAAITMNQTGDWMTPKYPDGSNRFIKPPVTYWAIAGSYSVFGIGPFSSRLPFALISAAIIMLTYWLANGLATTRGAGWLAGWIMASNLFLVQATGRAIPDLPLTLFLLISAAGWLNWMTAEKSARWAPWAAYAGAGLAVASKGLPAGVFLGLSAVFALFNPWRPLGLLRILHVPAIALGAALGLGWFLAMYWIHGDAALSAFFSDQVGKRVDFDFLKAAGQWLLSLLAMIIGFLPWLWPARKKLRAA